MTVASAAGLDCGNEASDDVLGFGVVTLLSRVDNQKLQGRKESVGISACQSHSYIALKWDYRCCVDISYSWTACQPELQSHYNVNSILVARLDEVANLDRTTDEVRGLCESDFIFFTFRRSLKVEM